MASPQEIMTAAASHWRDRSAGAEESQLILGTDRYQLLLLHTLVTIVLSYQLLFSESPLISPLFISLTVLGLLGTIVAAALLPARLFKRPWAVPALALLDTAATSLSIYLSGSASTNLYVTYFLVMLIAAVAPTLKQVMVISVLLCAAYGGVLYAGLGEAASVRQSHLLQIPILLILAIFYGLTNEAARRLGRDKSTLIDYLSERQRLERAVRESEQRVRLVLEHALDAFVMMNSQGLILEWNRQAETLFGWSRDAVVGRRLSDTIIPPRYRAAHEAGVARFLKTGEGPVLRKRIEIEGMRRDGRLFPLELSVSPLRMNEGIVFTAFLRDISERKGAEEALRQSEDRYRRLVEVSPDAILLTRDNRMVFLNRAGMDLLGAVSPEQVLGRNPADFFDPTYDEATIARVRRTLESGSPLPLTELAMLRLDGSLIHVNLVVSTLDDPSGPTMQLVLRNITDRKRLEEQFRQSQKMEAVGQLAGGVAHDFNNMLLVIGGYSDILEQDEALTPEQRQAIDQIRLASDRAKALTSQLLAFSRRQVLQPKIVSPNTMVLNMEQMLKTLTGEEVELCFQLDPRTAYVKADPSQIEQALLNLAVNARDAMPNGGRLTVVTEVAQLDQASIDRQRIDLKPGAYVRVAVQDSGVGIDPEILPRIFEPFFTTKPKGKGTGLGLSTVYGIIKQSGGALTVSSEPGCGTEMAFYLPQVEEAAVPAVAHDAGPHGPLSGNETIVVAEDEPGVRTVVCSALRRHGYTVLEARHGIEAVTLVRMHPGRIHLLVTDVVMPQMSGREVAEAVAAIEPNIKILYMSGYTDDAVLRHGIVTDAVNFIQKPYTCETLVSTVRRLLDGDLVHAEAA